MARQILPIAGQIVGGMIGGPVGAAIGGAIGSAVGAYVDPIRHQGPKLGEARAQTAQEGVYRPLVFGTGCVSGNVIHRSPRKVVRHRERVGKGGRDTVDSDRGYRTFAIRIAEAHTPQGYALLRIWENEKLVYDVRPESEIPEESAEYAEKFRFYAGTQDQLPDPDLEAYLGVGNVNAYRGSCYIVFGNFDLTDYGDMVPQYRFEIASAYETEEGPYFAISTAQTSGQISRSFDWQSWETVNTGHDPGSHPHLIEILNQNLFVIYQGGGRVATDGRGDSFLPLTFDPPLSAQAFPSDMAWSEESGYVITFVGQADGIYRSFDGVNFSRIHVGASSTYRSVAVAGPLICVGLDHGGRVLVSINAGASFGTQETGLGYGLRFADYDGANFLVAEEVSNHVAYSTSLTVGAWTIVGDVHPSGTNTYGLGSAPGQHVLMAGGGENAYASASPSIWAVGDTIPGSFTMEPNSNSALSRIASSIHVIGDSGDIYRYRGMGSWEYVSRVPGQSSFNGVAGFGRGIASGDRIPLRSVIEFCHRRVGQSGADYDLSDISDLIDGVVFADGYSARDAITSILPAYNLDASEHDRGGGYRINYIKRGAPVVRTLTIDDLVDEPEETVREDPMERPRVLHMAFESPVTGYTAAKASIQRLSPDVKLVNEVSTYVPVTFKDVNEAWQRADVQMRVAWTEVHGERTFSISDDQLDVVPTDVLALSLRGQLQRLRVLKVEYADGVLKMETVADRQSNYTSHVTGIPLPAPEKPPPSLMGPAAFAILDIPAISDQHDRLGYYVAVCGTTEAYAGAVIQRQQNGEWADVVRLGRSQRAIMGVLEDAVSSASPHYTDTTNTVSVRLYMDDELESLSQEQFLSEGGAFALETDSGWEIMQYRDAEQDEDGIWHLNHLARGRLNTSAAAHVPGSRFVLLDGVRFIDATVGMIGQPLTLRAASVGRSPETAMPETITYQGNSQREFPVAHLFAEIDGGTLSAQAVPRDRFGTEDHPVRSINHGGFRWSATDGVETVTVNTDHATASINIAGMSGPITVSVSQVNRFTGPGPIVSEQVE